MYNIIVRIYMCCACVYVGHVPGIAGQPYIWLERYQEEISAGPISISHQISSPIYMYIGLSNQLSTIPRNPNFYHGIRARGLEFESWLAQLNKIIVARSYSTSET